MVNFSLRIFATRFFPSSLASTDICAAENIAIISYSFIHLYRVFPSFLPRCKSRKFGSSKVARSLDLRSWRLSFPQYGEQAQRDTRIHIHTHTHVHTHSKRAPKFSHEVVREVSSPSQLYRLWPVIVATPGERHVGPRSRSLVRSRVRLRKATNSRGGETRRAILRGLLCRQSAGIFRTLRFVSGESHLTPERRCRPPILIFRGKTE